MSARAFSSRWLNWTEEKRHAESLRERTRKTSETPCEDRFAGFAGAVKVDNERKKTAASDPLDGAPSAVRLSGTRCGDVWLVRDVEALADNPQIITAGLPVFFFDEVRHLAPLTDQDLAAVAAVKRVFPTSRVLQ